MDKYTGTIVYCLSHDQGALISLEEDKIDFEKLGKAVCGSNRCMWEIHGYFNFNDNGSISLANLDLLYDQDYYDRIFGGCWKIPMFLNEKYDTNYNTIP